MIIFVVALWMIGCLFGICAAACFLSFFICLCKIVDGKYVDDTDISMLVFSLPITASWAILSFAAIYGATLIH
jgi:hypothetical protein